MKKAISISFAIFIGIGLLSFKSGKEQPLDTCKCFEQKFALVPAGSVVIDGHETEVEGFYISKTEIANYQYNRFVQEVAASGNEEFLKKIRPSGSQWEAVCCNKPLVISYINSPDYSLHPAVNISYEGAVEYCKWLTAKANKEAKNGLMYECRLPSRAEWIRAAEGKLHRVAYAWGGPNIRNNQGCVLCQYNHSAAPKAVFDQNSYTVPTQSFAPNSIGLYNMNGNVAEMITERGIAVGGSWASADSEVNNQSKTTYEQPSPMIGFRPVVLIKKSN